VIIHWFKLAGCYIILTLFTQCSNNTVDGNAPEETKAKAEPKKEEPKKVEHTYHTLSLKKGLLDSLEKLYDSSQLSIILTLNRCDRSHLQRADTIIIPDTWAGDVMEYSPFPFSLSVVKDVNKIIFFSYYTQAFGVYESGKLVRWGATSMGKKIYQTPTGLFHANWKAVESVSTSNDEWILKWNVNIQNKIGVGWHLYAMPGYPASHSCIRLRQHDAQYLYDWVDQWVLKDANTLKSYGTPVIVFGTYPFGGRKPWKALTENAHALDIAEETLSKEVEQHLPLIIRRQQVADSIRNSVEKGQYLQ